MAVDNRPTVAVTGANSGIGLATCRALLQAGARVLMVCRSAERGAAARDRLAEETGAAPELFLLDLSEPDSVRAGAASLLAAHPRLDVLVNNAGAYLPERRENSLGQELTLAANHLGPFLLTHLLLPALQAAPAGRIVNLSSVAHAQGTIDLADLQRTRRPYVPLAVYADSKLANIHFTRELARRLAADPDRSHITANAVHPGVVNTGFAQDEPGILQRLFALVRPLFLSADKGADTSVYLALDPGVQGVSGEYFVRRRPRPPARHARDAELARRLWEASEALVSLRPEERLAPPPGGS